MYYVVVFDRVYILNEVEVVSFLYLVFGVGFWVVEFDIGECFDKWEI